MVSRAEHRIRISRLLRRLSAKRGERIDVAQLMDALGDRGIAALMLLLAIPNLVLLPPGTSTVLGVPLILVATQLALGRKSVWLPQAVKRWSFDRSVFAKVLTRSGPYLSRAEAMLAPRFKFMLGPVGTRLIGFGCLILAIILSLPIPFANFLSGLSISAFALGLLQRDGVAAALGWLLTFVSAVATALVSGAMWIVGKQVIAAMSGML